jgi:glycosidase
MPNPFRSSRASRRSLNAGKSRFTFEAPKRATKRTSRRLSGRRTIRVPSGGQVPDSLSDPAVVAARISAKAPGGSRTVTVDGAPVTIAVPFPSPQDWRDSWIYFVMIDRFNNPAGPPKEMPFNKDVGEFQGGTLEGLRAQLGYIKGLGAGAVWLSPVLKNAQWDKFTHHGYGIQDFLEIEPRFGTETELRALVDEAHARGMYVILDIVLNHAGNLFNYDGIRDDREWKEAGPEYEVFWRNALGAPQGAWKDVGAVPSPRPRDGLVWPKELQQNDFWRRRGDVGGSGDETKGDFGILKELVTEYLAPGKKFPVRDIMIRAHQYLIAKFDIDGFRIDTLKYVEEDFARVFGAACREFALSIGKRNFFTFGEIWEDSHDADAKIARFIGRNTDLDQEPIGVDAALDFPLFRRLSDVIKRGVPPTEIDAMFTRRREAHRRLLSSHGEASRFFVTFLDNHDLDQRFYFQPPGSPNDFDAQLVLALTCLLSLQGIPCIYYGTEQGLHGIGDRREFVREALWGKPTAFDTAHSFYEAIQTIDAVRKSNPALRYGRQYFRELSGDGSSWGPSAVAHGVIAFSRILDDQEVVVVANTNTTDSQKLFVQVDPDLNRAGASVTFLFSNPGGAVPATTVVTSGGRLGVPVTLAPMQVRVLTAT